MIYRVINQIRSEKRVIMGLMAHGFGQFTTIASNIVVPFALLSALSIDTFGVWVVASSISQIMLMADLSLPQTFAINIISKAERNSKKSDYRLPFAIITAFVGLSAYVAVLGFVINIEYLYLTGALCCSVAMSLYANLWMAEMRILDRLPESIFISNLSRLIEALAIICFVTMFRDAQKLGASIVATRVVISIFFLTKISGLIVGPSLPRMSDNFHGNLSNLRVVFAQTIQLHSLQLIIGNILGAVSAGIFNVHRTLARLPNQAHTPINSSLTSEIIYASGDKNNARISKLYKLNILSSIIIYVILSGVLIVFSPLITEYWLRGKIQLQPQLMIILALASLGSTLVSVAIGALQSLNDSRMSSHYLMYVYMLQTVVVYFIAKVRNDLESIAVALLAIEWLLYLIIQTTIIKKMNK